MCAVVFIALVHPDFSQIAAQTLVADKDYGLAVSYCISAEDWRGLGRVVDRVLEEYITSGASSYTIT